MRPTRRVAATCGAILAAVVAGAGGAHAAGPSTAGAQSDPARDVGGFLARQLDAYDGVLPYPGTDQADAGLTIDAVLGMLATGTGPDQARLTADAVAGELGGYLGPGIAPTELYAGPVAKSVLFAAATGGDPRAFAGRDLVADLAGLEGGDGRYADRTAYGDTSNTYTQALGILATTRVEGAAPAKPVSFLLDQQCADGGFRLYVDATECVSDPDPTALAVVALRGTGEQPAADRALRYLAGRMDAAGGLAGGTGASTPNSNTTGLAAMAFAVSGEAWGDATRLTQGFLTSLQFGCSASDSLRGAVAYDATSYAAGLASGGPASDQERRASAQAALGLAGISLAEVSIDDAAAPSTSCGGPTDPSTSAPPTSATGTSSSATSTSGATSWPPGPATVTITRPGPAVTTTVHATVTAPAETITRTDSAPATSTAPAPSVATIAATAVRTSPADRTASAAASAVAAAPEGGARGGTSAGPLAIAGALVLLGAAGAGAILRRGRTH